MRERRFINGKSVRQSATGAWFYEGTGTTPGAVGAHSVGNGFWFYEGTGVAV